MRSISCLIAAASLATTAVYALPQVTPPNHIVPCPVQDELYAHGDDTSDLILGNVIWSFSRSDSCVMPSTDANARVTEMLAESVSHVCSQALPHDYKSADGKTPQFHLTLNDGAPDLSYGDFQKLLARIAVGLLPISQGTVPCRTGQASLLNAPDGQAQTIVGSLTFN